MAKFLTVVDNLLTKDECQSFIKRFEGQALNYVQSNLADYHRGMFADDELATKIYDGLFHIIFLNAVIVVYHTWLISNAHAKPISFMHIFSISF